MFDFDFGKLVVIGVVALIVIGPKDLPRVMRQVGQIMGKMRRMASDFQGQFMEAMREADIDDLKKDIEKAASIDVAFDPLRDAHEQLVKAVEDNPTAAAALATVESSPAELTPPAVADAAPAGDDAPADKPRARKPRVKRQVVETGDLTDDAPAAPKKRARAKKASGDETAVTDEQA